MMKLTPTHASGFGRAPSWLRLGLRFTAHPFVLLSLGFHRPLFDFLMRKESFVRYMTVAALLVGVGYDVALVASRRLRSAMPTGWLK